MAGLSLCPSSETLSDGCPHQVLWRHRALLGHRAHGLDKVPNTEVAFHLDPGVLLAVALLMRWRARHKHYAVWMLARKESHLRTHALSLAFEACKADGEGCQP